MLGNMQLAVAFHSDDNIDDSILLDDRTRVCRTQNCRSQFEREKRNRQLIVARIWKIPVRTGCGKTDTARRISHVSPRFALAIGVTQEEIEGKPFLQMVAGEALGHWEISLWRLHDLAERLKRRDSFSNILIPVQINGETRWWELSASPKLDESGVFHGFSAASVPMLRNSVSLLIKYRTWRALIR